METNGLMPGYKEPDSTLRWFHDQGKIDDELAEEVAAGRFQSIAQLKAKRDGRQKEARDDLEILKLKKEQDEMRGPVLGGPATHPAGVMPSTRPADVTDYHSKTLRLRIGHPLGWEVRDPLPKDANDPNDWFGIWEPDDGVPGMAAASIDVQSIESDPDATLQTVLAERAPWLDPTTTQPASNYKLLKHEKIKMGADPAYLLLERFTPDAGSDQLPSDMAEAFTVHRVRVYIVHLSFAPNQWPRYEPMFRAILARFAVDDPK